MNWRPLRVEWTRPALADAKPLDRKTRERIVEAVDNYALTGRGDVEHVKSTGEYRLRVGRWRIFYFIVKSDGILEILRVRPREGAYKP